MDSDLVIVGAGPAGISTAIEAREAGIATDRILVLEKGPVHSYAIRKYYDHVVYALGGTTPAGFLQATGIELLGGEPILKDGGETPAPRKA